MLLVVLVAGPAHADFDPLSLDEPYVPYAQPADTDVPQRGCATTPTDPKNAAGSIPAAQVIYAWSDEFGNRYEEFTVEKIAKIVDRLDWSLDRSTNYEPARQAELPDRLRHRRLRATPAPSWSPRRSRPRDRRREPPTDVIKDDLAWRRATTPSAALTRCSSLRRDGAEPSANCSAYAGDSDRRVGQRRHAARVHPPVRRRPRQGHRARRSLHETADVMSSPVAHLAGRPGVQQLLQEPSELTATFYTADAYPHPRKANLATWSMLTAPRCCDVGYSNDLLTAQERTIEADAPYACTPAGFTPPVADGCRSPPGPRSKAWCRASATTTAERSLTMNVQSWAEGVVGHPQTVGDTGTAA